MVNGTESVLELQLDHLRNCSDTSEGPALAAAAAAAAGIIHTTLLVSRVYSHAS